LQRVLLETRDHDEQITLYFPSELSNKLSQKLQNYGCNTQVELELVGIVANAQHLGMKLLMVGESANRSLEKRWLHNANTSGRLKREISWLLVYLASHRERIFEESDVMKYHARIFELQAAINLQTQHSRLHCIETPQQVKGKLQEKEGERGGDIDLYGYEEFEDKLVVWVGECKLRKEGQERRNLIKTKEINQLNRKIQAAGEYETNRSDLAGTLGKLSRKKVEIRGLIISNAEDFYDDLTRQEAKRLQIELWQAKLLNGWMTNVHWHIHQLTSKL
jgi:hypothetical protein